MKVIVLVLTLTLLVGCEQMQKLFSFADR